MNVVICSNTEILGDGTWNRVFDEAGLHGMHDYSYSLALAWSKTVSTFCEAQGWEWQYNDRFQDWRGGWLSAGPADAQLRDGGARVTGGAEYDALRAVVEAATDASIEEARAIVDEFAAAAEEA